MYETTLEELQQLVINAHKARQYAVEHYEELVARKHTHTLYGPHDYFLGASVPCNTVVPKRARKLMHKTRRKEYIIYQLDEQYKVLRTILVNEHPRIDVIYHHFELDGVVYAFGTEGTMQDGEVYPHLRYSDVSRGIDRQIQFLRFENGKPVSYGNMDHGMLFVQFYEYVANDRMLVTTYRYKPYSNRSFCGYPIDPEAPIGSPNSPVHQRFYEQPAENTDFSRWFK